MALVGSLAAQTPARDLGGAAASAPTGTASISGVVMSADGIPRPLRLVNLVLIGAATGVLRVSSSDRDGRFSFAALPADRYLIGASKPPYLGTVAGARRPARPGTPIAVGDGQTIADVVIRMPPGAAISGVITDDRGQPGVGMFVSIRQRRVQGTERVLASVPGGSVAADDRGRYRVYGLPPGEYVVVATRGPGVGPRALADTDVDAALKGAHVQPPLAVDPSVPSIAYAPAYFPGTVREADATPITLAVGEERTGVDFRVDLVRTARVEGIVSTSDGQPVANISVRLMTASASNLLQSTTRVALQPDGRFVIANILPGSYTLLATTNGPQAGQFAIAAVDVAGMDQAGIQLILRPNLNFSGRIAFAGAAPPPSLAGRRVPFQSVSPGLTGGAAPQVSPTNATGTFTVPGVLPGRYILGGPLFFGATNDSVTWALQSVVVDGRDVTDVPFEVRADSVPKDVVVTYGDRWQQLSGRLQNASGAAVPDDTIVVFPADKAYWIPGSRRILTAHPGSDGRFTLGGSGPTTLPAGAYLLAAVTELDRDEQFDPALLESLRLSAVPVTLQPGERRVQDLVIR
jgi:hypothetical protein